MGVWAYGCAAGRTPTFICTLEIWNRGRARRAREPETRNETLNAKTIRPVRLAGLGCAGGWLYICICGNAIIILSIVHSSVDESKGFGNRLSAHRRELRNIRKSKHISNWRRRYCSRVHHPPRQYVYPQVHCNDCIQANKRPGEHNDNMEPRPRER